MKLAGQILSLVLGFAVICGLYGLVDNWKSLIEFSVFICGLCIITLIILVVVGLIREEE
jgi:hypothetical protein